MAFGSGFGDGLGSGRIGGRRPPLGVPPPAAPPAANPAAPAARPPAQRRPPAGTASPAGTRPGQMAPNPAKDPLPPMFAKMVANGMSEQEARRRWGRSLQNRGKMPPAATPTAPKPPGTPTPPGPPSGAAPPPPAPGTPVGPPMPAPGPGPAPGDAIVPGGSDFRDPMMQFLSAVPMMNANMQRQIGDAMASAGFTGNRWGTSAMNAAGQIGAENALTQNAMLQQLLADYSNRQEDRALQATGMGMGLGDMLDRQAQDRVRLPFELGQYEQGRQDRFADTRYRDFESNKLGWLPMLLQAATSQGSGTPGSVYTTSEPGKPGAADWLTALGPLLGLFA